ncbi:MAG: NAD-dependent deacylase [candidate division WOR-3 bacterium]|nr:MAG: NAD-dependent deacylase [candidate division WOR-3 bacterium]
METTNIDRARDLIIRARSVFVLTGAGISAESGIPTFRGTDGLWKNYSTTDLATPEAFKNNPTLVWEWYHWRQRIISQAQPNPAHQAIVQLEKHAERFLLLTQNVDGLHVRAGSKNVLELHGNIFRARCLLCGATLRHLPPDTEQESDLPRCTCGGLLRPDVVWFGETIPQDIWHTALTFLTKTEVAIICGTSGVVWPAASIPEIARHEGIATIEVNLEPTGISTMVDVSIQGKAGKLLPQLLHN